MCFEWMDSIYDGRYITIAGTWTTVEFCDMGHWRGKTLSNSHISHSFCPLPWMKEDNLLYFIAKLSSCSLCGVHFPSFCMMWFIKDVGTCMQHIGRIFAGPSAAFILRNDFKGLALWCFSHFENDLNWRHSHLHTPLYL